MVWLSVVVVCTLDTAVALAESPARFEIYPPKDFDPNQYSNNFMMAVVDVDDDGLEDVVTGKRFWAHGPTGDPDPDGTPFLYWFKRSVKDDTVTWTPHMIDNASGVGMQLAIGDLNGDKRPDLVVGNKKGGFIFIQKPAASDAAPPR